MADYPEAVLEAAHQQANRLLQQAMPLQSAPWVARLVDAVVDATLDAANAHQTPEIEERDHAEGMADRLAARLAEVLGQPDAIGEHSSANDPWENALDLPDLTPAASGQQCICGRPRTESMSEITITTDEEFEEWASECEDPLYFIRAEHTAWVAFCAEQDGDWYATRPANDDEVRPDGSWPGGVTVALDTLRPLVVVPGAVRWEVSAC